MTIEDKLTTIGESLQDIKEAIINKGQTITGNITTYADKINDIQSGVTPTGALSITANGVYDVTNYASADVSVSGDGVDGYVVVEAIDIWSGCTLKCSGYTLISSNDDYYSVHKTTLPFKFLFPINTLLTFQTTLGYAILTIDGIDTYIGDSSSPGSTTITFTNSSSAVTLSCYPIAATCCIPYYTPVNYFNGSTKTAECVQVGDKLLGYDENTRNFVEVEVLSITHKLRSQLVKVTTNNYELELTPDHPILTDKGWAVYNLDAGNYKNLNKVQLTTDLKMLTMNGDYEDIVSIEYRELDVPIDTYTFNVTNGIDTYIAAGLISHNADFCE